MFGVPEVTGAIGGLKTALDIAKGLKATSDAVAINEAKIGLQAAILEAQSGLLAAQEAQVANLRRIDELEKQIVKLKDWSAESEHYEPVDIYLGTIAYMPKIGMENGQPPHWLCANCFEQGRKSFLVFKGQDSRSGGGRGLESTWGCDACKSSIKVSYQRNPAKTQERRLSAGSPD